MTNGQNVKSPVPSTSGFFSDHPLSTGAALGRDCITSPLICHRQRSGGGGVLGLDGSAASPQLQETLPCGAKRYVVQKKSRSTTLSESQKRRVRARIQKHRGARSRAQYANVHSPEALHCGTPF